MTNISNYDILITVDKLRKENKGMTTMDFVNNISSITDGIDSGTIYYDTYANAIITTTTTTTANTKADTCTNNERSNDKKKVNPYTIVDYKIINNTVVIFTFADGTTEKTVCNHDFDEFELKRAVELAICKKKFGGTKAYNNAIRNAIKQIENIDDKKKAEEEEKERIANRKAKYAERQEKRKAKRRQEQIDIQSEAFYNAMMKYNNPSCAAETR